MNEIKHVFEHLGKPPYTYSGYSELLFVIPGQCVKAGGSCDHCGTAIRHAFYFTSSDGHKFKVGSSCVKKSGDKGLRLAVNEQEKVLRQEKKKKEEAEVREALLGIIESKKDIFQAKPHANSFYANKGQTLYDYLIFKAKYGNLRTCKHLVEQIEHNIFE